MESIIAEWEACFEKDYQLVKSFKKATTSPSVFEHFDVEYDFQRLGIEYHGGIQSKKEIQNKKDSMSQSMLRVVNNNVNKSSKKVDFFDFRLVDNTDGKICSSYPAKFLTPTIITNAQISKIASFRARERLPILTFVYKNPSSTCIL